MCGREKSEPFDHRRVPTGRVEGKNLNPSIIEEFQWDVRGKNLNPLIIEEFQYQRVPMKQ
jgi:hypothetical protein